MATDYLYVQEGYVDFGFIQDGIYIDWNTKIIHIPKFYLEPVSSNLFTLDTYPFKQDIDSIMDDVADRWRGGGRTGRRSVGQRGPVRGRAHGAGASARQKSDGRAPGGSGHCRRRPEARAGPLASCPRRGDARRARHEARTDEKDFRPTGRTLMREWRMTEYPMTKEARNDK